MSSLGDINKNMGMYTELILGAELKTDTPENVIQTLKFMVGDTEEMPENFPFPKDSRYPWMLRGSSFYFAVCNGESRLFEDYGWRISSRSNIKNYENEIEKFLEWLKPYICGGSGQRDFYAIVCYEEQSEPTIYYLAD